MPMNRIVKKFLPLSALAAAAAALAMCLGGPQAQAEPNRVTFPKLEDLVHYTTVRRGEVTEHISTTRAAIEAI